MIGGVSMGVVYPYYNRLILVCLVTSLVNLSGCGLVPYLHDMVTILRYTLVDPYPEVKKVSPFIKLIIN